MAYRDDWQVMVGRPRQNRSLMDIQEFGKDSGGHEFFVCNLNKFTWHDITLRIVPFLLIYTDLPKKRIIFLDRENKTSAHNYRTDYD